MDHDAGRDRARNDRTRRLRVPGSPCRTRGRDTSTEGVARRLKPALYVVVFRYLVGLAGALLLLSEYLLELLAPRDFCTFVAISRCVSSVGSVLEAHVLRSASVPFEA